MSPTRRGFLAVLGAVVGGVALEQAIPLGRVWSFPTNITVTKAEDIWRQLLIYQPGDQIKFNEKVYEVTDVKYDIYENDVCYTAIHHIVSPTEFHPSKEDFDRVLLARRKIWYEQLQWKQTL